MSIIKCKKCQSAWIKTRAFIEAEKPGDVRILKVTCQNCGHEFFKRAVGCCIP